MAQQIALAIQRYKIGFRFAVRHADKKRIHQYFIFSLRVHKSFVGKTNEKQRLMIRSIGSVK